MLVRLLAVFLALGIPACSRAPIASARTAKGPVTLTIGWPFLSGQASLNGLQQAVGLLSFEGLVTIGRDGRPQPRLAESWSVSPDGLSWTFQLRPKAVFHDGSPVDSTAVKNSLERTLERSDRDFSPGLLDIVDVDTPTPNQVTIRLKTRTAFLLDDLVVSIEKPGPGKQSIGTGPYVTDSASPTEVVMKAFPLYYRGVPTVEQIVWKSYPTARTSWAEMMRGQVDFLYEVPPDAREFMTGEASVEDFSFLRNYVHGVVFNSHREIFKDSRVRRALNYAIDRSAIIDGVFKGHGVPAYTPTWPQHWAYDTSLPTFSYDPVRATALLNAAGLSVDTPARTLNGPPARLRFKCIFPTSLLRERMSLIVQRNLSQIGVDMQLESLSLDEFNHRIASGDFDAVLMDFVVGNATSRPYFFWYSTSGQNPWGYRDEMVDQALDHLRYAPNDDATRAAFRELQTQMLDDPPALLLAFGETTRVVSKRFQPVTPPGGDIFRTISEWQLAEGLPARNTN